MTSLTWTEDGMSTTARNGDVHLHIERAISGQTFLIEIVSPSADIRQRVVSNVTLDQAKAAAEAMLAE